MGHIIVVKNFGSTDGRLISVKFECDLYQWPWLFIQNRDITSCQLQLRRLTKKDRKTWRPEIHSNISYLGHVVTEMKFIFIFILFKYIAFYSVHTLLCN